MKRTLVLGGPGAGKTTRLLQVMEETLARGVPPSAIAFVSFTNAAVDEAKARACNRFGVTEKELPYFRTLHSLCFRELGLSRGDVFGAEHRKTFGGVVGETFRGGFVSEDGPVGGVVGADQLLALEQYARATGKDTRQAWEDHGGDMDWFRFQRFVKAYQHFKDDFALIDFTDMLELYTNSPVPPVPVAVAIVDEAQDLNKLQWGVVHKAFGRADELWVGGDDDQSIHRWAGASAEYFMALGYQQEVLEESHRLPKSIFAMSQRIIHRVRHRYQKMQRANRGGGVIDWVTSADEAVLAHGTWLLLARTRAQLTRLVDAARAQGVAYTVKGESSVDAAHLRAIQAHEALRAGKRVEGYDAEAVLRAAGVRRLVESGRTYTAAELCYDAAPIWHDALIQIPLDDREYYLSCLRREEKLTGTPRVRIETIHGAKGLEAENVLLSTDLTYRTQRGYELDPDSEHRVFYVGATRASKTLTMIAPQTAYGYHV